MGPPGGACIDAFELCTIPRSERGPVLRRANDHIGTYVPSVRIGDVLYSTNPGEAFPEVNDAISNSVTNARSTNVVGMAGDMLGYYYQRGDYTEQEFGSSDFERFNVGPDLAQDNADLGTANAAALGFATTPTATVFAPHDASVADKPGVQFYPDQVESSDPTINFYGSSAKSQDGPSRSSGTSAGTSATARPARPRPRSASTTRSPAGQLRRDRDGDRLERQDPLLVADDRHRSAARGHAELTYRSNKKASLSVTSTGGQGTLVSATGPARTAPRSAGSPSTAPGRVRARPRSRLLTAPETRRRQRLRSSRRRGSRSRSSPCRRRPRPASRRRSRSGVENTGGAPASKSKVCLSVKGKASLGLRLYEARDLEPGKSKSAKGKLKMKKKAKGKLKIKATVTSKDAAKSSASVKTKVKRKG